MTKPQSQEAVTLRHWAKHADRGEARAAVAALTRRLIAEEGRGLDLDKADLAGLDLSDFDLRRAQLHQTILHDAKLDRADLSGAVLLCPGAEKTSFRHANLRGAYLHAFAGQVCDFSHASFDEAADLTGGLFHGCRLDGADFGGAMLAGTAFYQCQARAARFDGADLEAASFVECTLDQASFGQSNIALASFRRCGMRATSLASARGQGCTIQSPTGADGLDLSHGALPELRLSDVTGTGFHALALSARGMDAIDCRLAQADFQSADLRGARFVRCALPGARLQGALLADAILRDADFSEAIWTSVAAENLHALNTRFSGADFSGLKARCAVFRACHMERACFDHAYLYRAVITGDPPASANLRGACFDGAVLVQAYLCADLTGARLTNARLNYVRLNQSILDEADLRGSPLPFASVVKVSFRGARLVEPGPQAFINRCDGLEEVRAVVAGSG